MGSICSTEDKTHNRGAPGKLDRKGTGGTDDEEGFRRMSTRQDRRGTRAPNFKNFKNLKQIENIEEIYRISDKKSDQLGEGSFGAVKKVERIGTKTFHALKTIKKSSLDKNPMLPKLMISELQVLQDVTHPHIMHVNEILEDTHNYYIVTEILEGGELFDRIIEVKKFNELKAAEILEQVLKAINYMHK